MRIMKYKVYCPKMKAPRIRSNLSSSKGISNSRNNAKETCGFSRGILWAVSNPSQILCCPSIELWLIDNRKSFQDEILIQAKDF